MNEKDLPITLSKIYDERTCPVAVFIKNKKVLCGFRHYKLNTPMELHVWTCPGGRPNKNEIVETTLRREVAEETGITDFRILNFIGEFEGSHKGDTLMLFICETSQSPKLMEPEKFSEWKWFSSKDFPKNFINSTVRKAILKIIE